MDAIRRSTALLSGAATPSWLRRTWWLPIEWPRPAGQSPRDIEPVNTYRFIDRFNRPSAGGARVGTGGVYRAATERLDDAAIDEDPGRVVRGTGYGDDCTLIVAFDQP